MADEMDLWLAFLIVGTIDDHWWGGSQGSEAVFCPDKCGPCGALRDMPPVLRREAVRTIMRHEGGEASTYWDTANDDFREGVDFTKPGDIEALCAAEKAEIIGNAMWRDWECGFCDEGGFATAKECILHEATHF